MPSDGRHKITTGRLRAIMEVMGIPGGEAVGTEDTKPDRPPRGFACGAHVFAAHVCADPGLVWTEGAEDIWLPVLAALQRLLTPG
jgi:hypothetical protein